MVAGGNAVVFNAHPYAARTSAFLIHLFNDAIVAAGGPENLLACVERPTIESAEALMKHPGVRLLVVTGGPGVVKAAMGSGKKVIAAGPGNPPAVVDETADLDVAAAEHRAGRVDRQQHPLHRGEGGRRGRVDRRRRCWSGWGARLPGR